MKRFLPVLLLGACSLISPYSIIFTTPNESIVNPATDTLNLVVSEPALAYVSHVDCDAMEPIDILPIVHEGSLPQQAWNLKLDALDEVPAGTLCKITVGAFDQTTTASSYGDIELYVLEGPAAEVAPVIETPVVETPVIETPTLEVTPDPTAPAEEPVAEPVLGE